MRSDSGWRGEDAPPGDSRARLPVKSLDKTNESWLAERRSDIEREILRPAREMLEAAGPNGDMRVGTAVSAVTTNVADRKPGWSEISA